MACLFLCDICGKQILYDIGNSVIPSVRIKRFKDKRLEFIEKEICDKCYMRIKDQIENNYDPWSD